MALTNWWLVLLALIVIGVGLAVLLRRPPRRSRREGDLVVTSHVRDTDRFAVLARLALRRSLVLVVSLACLSVGSLLLAGRLSFGHNDDSRQHNRDVMLCLDVSGSMSDVDAALMEQYAEISKNLAGERIGLSIWDSSTVLKFPLTNDYDFVAEQLADGAKAIDEYEFDWYAGTSEGDGSSLIGDGLASCVQRFDRLEESRARAIILATDNQVNGDSIYTLKQAADLAVKHEIVVYAISPYDWDSKEITELRRMAQRTGGQFVLMDDETGGERVAQHIQRTEAQRLEGMPSPSVNDFRLPGLLLMALGLLGTAWCALRRWGR